jgi:hypothetical protein
MNLNTEEEKNFIEFSNEERNILLQNNYIFLNNELINWKKVNKKIKISLKEKGKKIGLENLKMKISEDNRLTIQPNIFIDKFDMFKELKKNEKNEENIKVIDIAIKNSVLISDISKNQMNVDLVIEKEKLSMKIDYHNLGFFLGTIIADIETFLTKIKENSINKEILNKVKKIQLQHIYNTNIENKIFLDLLIKFVKDKLTEMRPFEIFLESKIEEIRKEIEVDIPLNDIETLENLLIKRTDILFDKQGRARKHRK